MVGAERAGLLLLVRAAGDRDGLEPHPAGELHAEMAEAADAEDGDEVAGTRAASRSALKVVMPAQSSGAASSADRSSGIEASALFGTTTWSA